MTKDFRVMDTVLPTNMLIFLTAIFNLLYLFSSIAINSALSLILIVPILVLYVWAELYYRKKFIHIQMKEIISRNPIFSNLSDSFDTSNIIRAMNLQDFMINRNAEYIDTNTNYQYISNYSDMCVHL